MRRCFYVLPATLLAIVLLVVAGCDESGPTSGIDQDAPTARQSDEALPAAKQSVDIPEEDLIPGQYIAVFKDDIEGSKNLAEELVSAQGGEVLRTFWPVLNGFEAKLSEEGFQALRDNSQLKRISQSRLFHLSTVQNNPPWGLDRIDRHPNNLDNKY